LRVLVTGASGYLGGLISEHLAKEGHNVIALVRKLPHDSTGWQKNMAQVLVGDIRNDETVQKIIAVQAEAVIYTISLNHKQSEEDIDRTLATNVTPLWKLLDRLVSQGAKRFIYFSTQQVYGKLSAAIIDEHHLPNPQNSYGLTHLMCEQICRLYTHRSKIQCVNLRLSNGYGAPRFQENDCWWLVINDFCQTAFQAGKIRLLSNGMPQRDFIHSHDICQAVNLLLQVPEERLNGQDFNLGSGSTYTILELAHIVAECYRKKFNKDLPVVMPDGSVSMTADDHLQVMKFRYDIRQISSLGYIPHTSLESGINEILEFLSSTSNGNKL